MSYDQKLRHAAWTLKAAGVMALHSDWSEEEVQQEVKKYLCFAN